MRVLFDQGTPVPIRRHLEGHEVRTVAEQGWGRLKNRELLAAAEAAGFDVLLTTDKNIRYQQNLSERKIAIVVLGEQQWHNGQGFGPSVPCSARVGSDQRSNARQLFGGRFPRRSEGQPS